MTEQTTEQKPKKKIGKKIFIVIAFVLALLGIDHYTFSWVSGGVDVTVTDSALAASPTPEVSPADTSKPVMPPDTAKTDSVKK